MGIYADALERNSAFYKFLRTLQAYEKVLDDKTTLFLPADAEILAILRQNGVAPDAPPAGPEAPVAERGAAPDGAPHEPPRLEALDEHRGSPATGVVP
jgi:hypothetical protein